MPRSIRSMTSRPQTWAMSVALLTRATRCRRGTTRINSPAGDPAGRQPGRRPVSQQGLDDGALFVRQRPAETSTKWMNWVSTDLTSGTRSRDGRQEFVEPEIRKCRSAAELSIGLPLFKYGRQ